MAGQRTRALLTVVLFALGCEVFVGDGIVDDGTVCAEARQILHACGATVPLLDEAQCAGPGRAVADCIVDSAADCTTLADLDVEVCLADALGASDVLFASDAAVLVPGERD